MILNIITPTFNDYENLRKTADSIFKIKIDRPDYLIKWIVIDNMSTDTTSKLLNQLKNEKVVDLMLIEPDKGIFDAMNKGLDLCLSCGHVLFLGAGDKIITLPSYLESETVYYGTTIVHGDKYFVSSPENYYINKFDTLHHQSMLVPTTFHRYFNTEYKICADEAHNIEMLMEGRKFEFCPNLLGFHLPGGISSDPKKVRKERNVIQQKLKDFATNGIIPGRI